jgi:hypothetical protein
MTLTRKQKIAFYRNKKRIDNAVLKEIKKRKLILFGARSLNRQLPAFLRKETKDYDVIVTKRNPKTVAKELEKKLDKKFRGNLFVVEKGKAEGVYKVKQVLGKEGIIDVVRVKEKVPFVKRKGVRVSTLDYEKSKIKESLANPKAKFRHDKDRERRGRIRIGQNINKQRRSKARKAKKFRTKPSFRVKVPRFNPMANI